MKSPSVLIVVAVVASSLGCSEATPSKEPVPSISQKVRIENLQARTEKSYRLSETETVKVIIVPGYPVGERCVVYSNPSSSAMQCREIGPSQQR